MTSFIPKSMNLAAERLAVTRNSFMLDTLSSNSSAPGLTTTFNLPEGSMLDLTSLALHATFKTTKSNATVAKLPEDISTMISRLEVIINGRTAQNTNDYHTISRIMHICADSREQDLTVGRLQSHSAIIGGSSAETYSACIRGFLGFMQNSAKYIDTALTGQIQIRITWSPREVLVFHDGATVTTAPTAVDAALCTYSVNDIMVTMDAVSMQDEELYNTLTRARIEEVGYVSYYFKEYYTFNVAGQTATSINTRANVSSSSIDKLYGVLRTSTYADGGKAAFTLPTAAVVLGDTAISPFMRFQSYDTATAANATADPDNEKDNDLRFQFSVGNVKHPQYSARVSQAIERLVYASPTGTVLTTSRTSFNQAHGVFVCPLCVLGEPYSVRSGYDSRGVSSQITWDVSGLKNAGVAVTSTLVVETTKELRVSAGRSTVVSD